MKIKLLIIDAHQLFLEGVGLLLSQVDEFEVLKLERDPIKGFDFYKKSRPDLLITDISMPNMNGVELIHKVKKIDPNQKILIISGYKCLIPSSYVDGYLNKSSTAKCLVDCIKSIILKNEKYYLTEEKEKDLLLETNNKILTVREKQITKLLSEEKSIPQIASHLNLSKYTVETHKKNIYRKLHVSSLSGLIKKAIYLGVVQ